MKYIRTKDGVYELMFPNTELFPNTEHRISFDHKTIECAYYTTNYDWVAKKDVIKESDNIEDLLDCQVFDCRGCDLPIYVYNKSEVTNGLETVMVLLEAKGYGATWGAVWSAPLDITPQLKTVAKLTGEGWKLV